MGKILVNNIDIENYGIRVTNDYLKQLFTLPEKEDVTYVEWYEGEVDVDLTDGISFKDSKEIKLECYTISFDDNFQSLVSILTSQAINNFTFEELSITIPLRLLKIENSVVYSGYENQKFTITLLQEDYNITFEDNHIIQNIYKYGNCFIDNIDISEYGFVLLEDSLNKLFNRDFHSRLQNANSSINKKMVDISLSFGSNGMNLNTFKMNFISFISLIISSGIKTLKIRYMNKELLYSCYYDNSNIQTFLLDKDSVFFKFDLILKCI